VGDEIKNSIEGRACFEFQNCSQQLVSVRSKEEEVHIKLTKEQLQWGQCNLCLGNTPRGQRRGTNTRYEQPEKAY
jgi:hypothetical protein